MVVWESAWVGVNKTLWIKMHGETVKNIYKVSHPVACSAVDINYV
jgi:hypothetical protein